jgi:hypothetical protein
MGLCVSGIALASAASPPRSPTDIPSSSSKRKRNFRVGIEDDETKRLTILVLFVIFRRSDRVVLLLDSEALNAITS